MPYAAWLRPPSLLRGWSGTLVTLIREGSPQKIRRSPLIRPQHLMIPLLGVARPLVDFDRTQSPPDYRNSILTPGCFSDRRLLIVAFSFSSSIVSISILPGASDPASSLPTMYPSTRR